MTQKNNQKSFFQKNKNTIISILVILLVVAFIFLVRPAGRGGELENTEVENSAENTEVVAELTEVAIPSGLAAYESAIESHAGKVVEVTGECVATPEALSIALGETALLVNSSDVAQTFTMGEDTFSVGSRHYKTLRFSEAQTATLSCGEATVATIEVK